MSNANLNKARELLIKKYTDALKQNILPWERGWYRDLPRNAITKTEYRGVNSLLLSFIAEERGYSGNRWCTFNQIADKDKKYHPKEQWHLKKGSESVPVEYWYVYNTVERKKYTFPEYNKVIISDPERIEEFKLEYDDKHIENHIAYIQSWIKVLENDPNELFRAIQDANKIVEYVEEKGEITKYNEPVLETVAVSNDDYEIEM